MHVDLNPVVVHDGRRDDWRGRLRALGDAVSPRTRDRSAAEILYRHGLGRRLLDDLLALIDRHAPYLRVRYEL